MGYWTCSRCGKHIYGIRCDCGQYYSFDQENPLSINVINPFREPELTYRFGIMDMGVDPPTFKEHKKRSKILNLIK